MNLDPGAHTPDLVDAARDGAQTLAQTARQAAEAATDTEMIGGLADDVAEFAVDAARASAPAVLAAARGFVLTRLRLLLVLVAAITLVGLWYRRRQDDGVNADADRP